MTPDHVRHLIDYHYWARDRMMEAVARLSADQFTRDLGNSFGSVRDTLAHLQGAESVWLARWKGEPLAGFPPADRFPDAASVWDAWRRLEEGLRTYFAPLDEGALARVIEYRTLAGAAQASVLWQMLQHVVNHGSYHRGQVTTLVRQVGAPPPKGMDLITFYRESGI